jgi:hypothetical protein
MARTELGPLVEAVNKEGGEYDAAAGEVGVAKEALDAAKAEYDSKVAAGSTEKGEYVTALQTLLTAVQAEIDTLQTG